MSQPGGTGRELAKHFILQRGQMPKGRSIRHLHVYTHFPHWQGCAGSCREYSKNMVALVVVVVSSGCRRVGEPGSGFVEDLGCDDGFLVGCCLFPATGGQ